MSGDDDDKSLYDVGFGKPPKRNRFRAGISGNPRGRPKGRLNFNDALIVVACRELGIDTLLSFDADFDAIPNLTRLK